MADGELKISLDDETTRRLKEAAEAAGYSVDDYARDLITEGLHGDLTESLEALAEYDRTGESIPLEQALEEFRNAVEAKLAARLESNR